MKGYKIDVIVEARMTSSRLPGKVLKLAAGKPMLQHMVERLRHIEGIADVIIATTITSVDNCIVELANRLGVPCFRGDEEDVLGRVVQAAQHFQTEVIVEITGDNPLLDPKISSDVVRAFLEHAKNVDYVANDLEATFPLGFNTRAFRRQVLESVERCTNHPVDREHVVNYICKHPGQFRMLNVAAEGQYRRPELRLTMDEQADYEVIGAVFEALYPRNPKFTGLDVISFLDANPQIRDHNRRIVQRTYSYDS